MFSKAIKDVCCKIIPPWKKNSSKKSLKSPNYYDFMPMMSGCKLVIGIVRKKRSVSNVKHGLLSFSGPSCVSFVQCWCLCGRKLPCLSLHLPDTSVFTYFYKQQLIGISRILAAGPWSNFGKHIWTH